MEQSRDVKGDHGQVWSNPSQCPTCNSNLSLFFSTRWGSTNRCWSLFWRHSMKLHCMERQGARPTFHGEAPARFATCPMPRDFEVGSPFRNCPEIQSHGLPNQNCSNLYILVVIRCELVQNMSKELPIVPELISLLTLEGEPHHFLKKLVW